MKVRTMIAVVATARGTAGRDGRKEAKGGGLAMGMKQQQ